MSLVPNDANKVDDARERSWRTFLQGFGIDVATAVALVLALAFVDISWTRSYWIALGLTVAKSVLQAGVAYVMRILVRPKVEN